MGLYTKQQTIIDAVGVEELILLWKDHFVNSIETPYLPEDWDKNYIKKIKVNGD